MQVSLVENLNMNPIKNAIAEMDVCFRVVDGPSCHPDDLATLPEEELDDLIVEIHHARAVALMEFQHLRLPIVGRGGTIYVGVDCEWEGDDGDLHTLSCQFHLVGQMGELAAVFFPKSGDLQDRLRLTDMLAALIQKALEVGVLLDYPTRIVVIGFFLRADLAMYADLIEFKNDLSNVGGKIATTQQPVKAELQFRGKDVARLLSDTSVTCQGVEATYRVGLSFCDVAKHAAEGVSLATLGAHLKLPKLAIPEGHSIAAMGALLAADKESFIDYGLRDAEIPVKYYIEILKFAREHIWSAIDAEPSERKLLPASAGALAVQLCKQTFKNCGLDYDDLFGLEEKTRTSWDATNGQARTVKALAAGGMRRFHEAFAAEAYQGGRNETFYVGPTLPGVWHDYDLKGAYTTGMLLIRPIDYAASYETKDVSAFLDDVMGFAWIDFEYPDSIRFPALPVRSDTRGLLFPRRGQSLATSPEIALAVAQGAKVSILRGVIYPWKGGSSVRIFREFVLKIRQLRAAYPKGSVPELTAKLQGNSLYGKTAQGVRDDKSAFDTKTMANLKVPHSAVTNAPIAALTTGFIRAVMGEILHRIPAHRTVVSVTTDGILTDAESDELDLSGPICHRFMELCEMVDV